jgi:serine/threonine-protein kinase
VRELVDGVPVAALGELPAPALLALARQLAAALAAVHGEGLVHGRVRGEDVLVEDGRVRLTGLGTAWLAAPAPAGEGEEPGLAPEQRAGGRADASSDVWAAGALLHRLAHGAWPGEATVEAAGLPAGLAAVLARATAQDPAERWADGGELLRALAGIAA